MSYLGNTPTQQGFIPAIDYFSGNASTVAFTLSRPVASVAQVQAVIENVPQNPGAAFTVSGNTITFTSAPPSGTNNIYVYYTSPITQVIQPGQGTVAATQVDGSFALWNKSGSTINYAAGSVGIGTSSPAYLLDISGNINGIVTERIINTNSGASSYSYLRMGNNADSDAGLLRNSSTNSAYGGVGSLNLYQGGANPIGFVTNNFERMRIRSDGGVLSQPTGGGTLLEQFGCRAWVNFNGQGTVAIRASGNVSSVTDLGTGQYRVNLTTAMPDANYAAVLGHGYADDVTGYTYGVCFPLNSSQVRVNIARDSVGEADTPFVEVAVIR
jgi:hypothetical protein